LLADRLKVAGFLVNARTDWLKTEAFAALAAQ